jgi:hypothetical protein
VNLRHCTLAHNRANTFGGALHGATAQFGITNNVFWGNSAGSGGSQIHESTANRVDVNYSDVQGGWSGLGTGNIAADPWFLGGPDGQWTGVGPYSPDAGQTTLTSADAGWSNNAYAGLTVNPDTVQYLQFAIASNSADTLYVWGNALTNYAGAAVAQVGDTYRIHYYQLKSGITRSACKDKGAAVGVTNDIVGAVRPCGPGVDMGAYEAQLPDYPTTLFQFQ